MDISGKKVRVAASDPLTEQEIEDYNSGNLKAFTDSGLNNEVIRKVLAKEFGYDVLTEIESIAKEADSTPEDSIGAKFLKAEQLLKSLVSKNEPATTAPAATRGTTPIISDAAQEDVVRWVDDHFGGVMPTDKAVVEMAEQMGIPTTIAQGKGPTLEYQDPSTLEVEKYRNREEHVLSVENTNSSVRLSLMQAIDKQIKAEAGIAPAPQSGVVRPPSVSVTNTKTIKAGDTGRYTFEEGDTLPVKVMSVNSEGNPTVSYPASANGKAGSIRITNANFVPDQAQEAPAAKDKAETPSGVVRPPLPFAPESEEASPPTQVADESEEASPTPQVEESPVDSLRRKVSKKFAGQRVKFQEKPDDDLDHTEENGVYSNGQEVIVTDEALAKIAENESLKTDRAKVNALSKLIEPMRNRLEVQDQAKQPALSDKEGNTVLTSEDVSTLNKESSYHVNRSDLETISKDEAKNEKKGIWRKLEGIKDKVSRTATYFSYTPAKGKVMKVIDGDILTISGDGPAGPSMLILESFKNGIYIFREALVEEINDKRSANSKKKTYKAINEYTKGILTQVAEKFAPYLNKNTGEKLDATSVEALFKEVMEVVSPETSFKVVKKNLSGEKGLYVYADLKGKGTIVVDYAKLAEQFNKQYIYNPTSEAGARFLGLDAARKMSSIIDEEIIHIIASRIFKPTEMEGFVNEILDEIEAGTKHPYIDLLRDTARERLDDLNDKSPDDQVDTVMMEMDANDLYGIGMELIRKVHQFSNSGFSTESASMQSIRLQAAIKGDEDKQTGKKSFIHTLGEMVRRYTDRIRKILWTKFQQKRISDTQRELLKRLRDAYNQVGIRGDVESAQENVKEDSRLKKEMYEKNLQEDVERVAMAHSATMSNVREFVKSKYGARLADLFYIDPKTMKMAVSPYYREELEESKVVMKDLDEFLDDLNGDGNKLILPAYQMAMTSSFFNQQHMEVLRDQLEIAFDDVDLFSGLVDGRSKGYLSDANLWQKVIDAAPDEVTETELLEAFSLAKVEQAGILNDQRAATELAKNRFLQEAFKELEGLEGKNDVQSLKKLVSWLKLVGFTDSSGVDPLDGYRDLDENDQSDFLEGKRISVMEKLTLMAATIGENKSFIDLGGSGKVDAFRKAHTLEGVAGNLLAEFRNQKKAESIAEKNFSDSNKIVLAKIKNKNEKKPTSDRALKRETEAKTTSPRSNKKITKEQFKHFVEFIHAVEDYNDSLINVIERSFGDFGRTTKEFGLNYADVSVSETEDGTTKFPKTNTQVEPVTSGRGQDVLSANILGRHVLKKGGTIDDNRVTYTTKDEQGEYDEINNVNLPLTKAQEERNAFLLAFRTRVQSNNKAAARFMYGDYWRAKHTLKIWDIAEMERYEKTGGFNLESYEDPDTEVVDYESPSSAFPSLGHQKFWSFPRRFSSLSSFSSSDNPALVLNELAEFLVSVENWDSSIKKKFQDSTGENNATEKIGGEQTIAGRWLPLLKEVFENAETVEGRPLYPAELGLYAHLGNFRAALNEEAGKYFTKKDGKIVLKEGVKAKDAAKALSTFLYDKSNPKVTHFIRSIREAEKVVSLTRGALGVMAGKDKESVEWRTAVEKEGSTTVRDITHIPHDERMEELRNVGIDVRAMNKVLWNLKFMENPRNYELSGNFALEMLPRFESLNRQSGREPFIYGEKDNSKEWLSPSQEDLYLSSDENADRVTRNLGDDIKIIEDEETGRLYYNRIAKANWNDLIVTDRDAIWDDVRFRSILTGEGQMPMLDDTQGNRVYNDDSQRRAANRVNVSAGIEITTTALLIGANSSPQTNPNGTQRINAQAGEQFLYDLIHMDLENKLKAEDIIRERKKYFKSTTLVPLIKGGERAMWREGFMVEKELDDKTIEKMAEDELQSTFRQAHYYHIIDRAMSGLFKNSNENAISPLRITELREQFLEKFGDGYSHSAKFLHDVLLFKASFEEAAIAKSRIQSGDMISSALGTIESSFETVFDSTQDVESVKKETKETIKKKLKRLRTPEKKFIPEHQAVIGANATADEASLIATAIKKWFTSDAISENQTKEEGKKSTYTADHPIYDGDNVMSLDLGDPILSNLLLLMEGKTILVTPNPRQVSNRALNGIGLRVFPGVNGSPNVVYAPLGVDLKGREAATAMTAALTSIARNSPEAKERINELADKFNNAIDPVMMAESIANKFSADVVSFRSDKADSSKNKLEELADFFSQAKETGLYERIHNAIPEGVDRDDLDLALDNHFLNASRVARELEVIMERSASMSMFPKNERRFITNAMLVAEMFTNPKVKQLLDDVYIGDDLMGGFPALVSEGDLLVPASIKDTGLNEFTEGRIFDQIKSIAGVATGDGIGDFTIEEDAKTAVEEQGQGLEVYDPTIGKAFPKTEAVDKALQDTQDKIGKKSTGKDLNDLLRQAAIERGDTYEANRLAVAGDFASDYLMFNFAASIIENGVKARLESGTDTSPMEPDQSGRDILLNSTDEGANTAIGTKNRKTKGKYSGEWMNILKPVKGDIKSSTWLNLNFRNNRIPNMNAAIFYQSSPLISNQVDSYVREMINEKFTPSVRKDVPEGSSMEIDGFPDWKFDPVGIEVPLTPEVLEQVRNQLPEGKLDRAIKKEMEGYKALQKELREVNSQLLKAEQEKAKIENSKKTRKSMEDFIANKASTLEVRRAVARDLATIFHKHHRLLSEEEGSAAEAASFFASRIGSRFKRNSHGMNSIARIGTNLRAIDNLFAEKESGESIRSQEEIDLSINGQIVAYNHHVDVVNSEIDTALEGAAALSGISFTTKFSPKKIHLKKMERDTTNITADAVNKLRESVKKIGDPAKIEKGMEEIINQLLGDQFMGATIGAFSARTAAITKPGAKGAKGKKARMGKFFADAMRFYDARLSGDRVNSLVTFLQKVEEHEGHYGVSMNELIGHLALNGDEANILITHGARTADEVQELMNLENEIKRLTAEDAQIKNHFQKLDDIDSPQSNAIGRTFFVNEVGYVNSKGDSFKVPRSVGIKLSLKPLVDLGEKAEVEDGKLDPIESDHRRMQYLFERNAILKSLEEFSVEYVEDAYNAMKYSGENFGKLDPARLAKNAASQVKKNAEIANEQLGRASSEALLADNRGMTAEAMAMLTDPKSKEYEALKVSQKKKLQRLRLPENSREREQMFGRYLNVDGEPIILMPTNAKEQLMLSHPKTVNVRNVNSQVAGVTLAALAIKDPTDNSDPLEVGEISFFHEALNNKEALSKKFKRKSEFGLTKGLEGDVTREEAADKFVAKYTEKLLESLNEQRNKNNKGKKKSLNFTGNNGESSLKQAEFIIKQLVLALDHEALASSLIPNRIIAMLKSIETENENESFAQVAGENVDFVRLHKLGLDQLISDTFSEIEGNFISKALSIGITVPEKGLDHMVMKYVHHSDARIRNSYRDSYISRQVIRHLTSFLESGFNNESGKDNQKSAEKLASKRIGEAQAKISNKKVLGVSVQEGDNKNHTIGYLISILNGMSNAHGQSLTAAFENGLQVIKLGIQQHRELIAKQNRIKSGKFLESSKITRETIGRLSKYWNNQNIDLVRDNDLVEEIARILRESKVDEETTHSTEELSEDQVTALRIESLKKALMSEVTKGKEAEVQEYADVLTDVFADIDSAMHLTAAITATEKEDTVRTTISSTPIRVGYAADPTGKKQKKGGKHIADPLDHVRLLDSSFFGGNITSSHTAKRRGIFRPLSVNGITTPASLVQDAIYRLNVAPTYGIMRKAIGRVIIVNGVPQVDPEESGIMQHIESLKPTEDRTRESNEKFRRWHELKESTATGLAVVAGEYETIIQNDFQSGVINTGGAEVMRVLGILYTARALASIQQRWDQTASPSIGYTMGKVLSGNARTAKIFWNMIGKMLSSKEYRREVRKFIEKHAPYVFYRAAEGLDVQQDQMKKQRRFGKQNKVKATAGQGVRKLEYGAEWALDWSIASGERVLASAIFMAELAQQMNTSDVDSILNGKLRFSPEQKNNAKTKVNDLMGQSDKSKMNWFFQTRDENPVGNALMRSITRFGTHTTSLASNTAVMSRVIYSGRPDGVSDSDWEANKTEAIENISTSLIQNALFPLLKVKMVFAFVSYVWFLAFGDDDDEAARKAQELSNKMIAVDDEGNAIINAMKTIIFGKKKEVFKLGGDMDVSQANALSGVLSQMLIEGIATIPVAGAISGFAPVQDNLTRRFTDGAANSLSSAITGVESSKISESQYKTGWIEGIFDLTAPSSVVYDYIQAGNLSLDYLQTGKFQNNKAAGSFDIAIYLLTEAIPYLREARGQLGRELKDERKRLRSSSW